MPEPGEVVVLGQHHRRAGGEVQREGGVPLAEVVLIEDEILREVGPLAEDQPADARVDKAELVTGDVDRPDLLEAEIPLGLRIQERPHEPTARRVDVEGHIDFTLSLEIEQAVVDAPDVVGMAGEGRAQHGGDADRVLIDERNHVLGPDHVLVWLQRHDPRLDVEVAAELLPDDMNVAAEDEIGLVDRAPAPACARATSTSATARRA